MDWQAPHVVSGGAKGNRTPDLVIANDALYQLSYRPYCRCRRFRVGHFGRQARVLAAGRANA
jgi:hypothetical protein